MEEKSLSLRQSIIFFSILASLWLLKHPYNGIWHDGVIYTFMALKDLYPENFAGDLFIKYGSQDNYTIFPQIYAVLIKYFGIYKSALILTVFGQILWISSSILLFRLFFKSKELYVCLAILFFMRAHYGGFNCFQYAEPFINPRIYSEALCILGVRCILTRKYVVATILVLLSFFIHPIITFSACLVFYTYLIITRPRFLFLAPILAVIILLLGYSKIEPLAGLFRFISPDWQQIIKIRSSFMFLALWPLSSWTEIFFTVAIVFIAILFSKDSIRHLFLASIIGACCGMLINIIGGEILKIELIMQIQAWRALWFVQFISALGVTVLIVNFLEIENRENRLLLCSFFVLTWYCISLGAISFGITLIFVYLSVQASRNDFTPMKSLRPTVLMIMAIIIIINIMLPYIIPLIKLFIKNDFNITATAPLLEYIFLYLSIPLILSLVIFFFYNHWDKSPSFMIYLLCFLLLIFSSVLWNRQSPWSKMLERNEDSNAFFRNVLPKDATVLWDGSSEIPWLGSRKPSYVSASQGSGVVFYKKTALEYAKRVNIILPLMDKNPMKSKEISYRLGWRLDKTKFKQNYANVCQNAEELDYIIATENIAGKPIAHWRSAVPIVETRILEDGAFEELKNYDFYLHDCDKYRKKYL